MRVLLMVLLLSLSGYIESQTLKSVSNADNDLKKHQQVLASRLLSWSTGSREQINYVSVGRYANYFGFVKMRVSSAHSLKRSEVGRETLSVLTDEQINLLFSLLQDQKPKINSTHASRLLANEYLGKLLSGEVSASDKEPFIELASQYAVQEAELGALLATVFSRIVSTLQTEQRSAFNSIRDRHTSGMAEKIRFNPDTIRSLSKEDKQEIFNLAARLLSWVTSDFEDITYETIGKPSQHFGFVSMRVSSNHGVKRGVIADEVVSLLTEDQRETLTTAAVADSENLEKYLQARERFLKQLTALRSGGPHNRVNESVPAKQMAVLEAQMTWDQALALKQILNSLHGTQLQRLIDLRQTYAPDPVNANAGDLYQQCLACHRNSAVAPDLGSIVNAPVAAASFDYSPAMIRFSKDHRQWEPTLLNQFLRNPQALIPGTMMSYKGIKDSDLREALVDYLSRDRAVANE